MTALEILGALKNYSTFGKNPLTGQKIRALPQRTHQARVFARELIKEAIHHRKYGIGLDLGFSFSFTGVITFARDYDGIVKYFPLGCYDK